MKTRNLVVVGLTLGLLSVSTSFVSPRASALPPARGDEQYVAVASSAADYAALRSDVRHAGGHIVREMPEINTIVVRAPRAARVRLVAGGHAAGVAVDHIESLAPPEGMAASPEHRVHNVVLKEAAPTETP